MCLVSFTNEIFEITWIDVRMSYVVEVPKALIVPNVSSYFRFQYRLVCSSLSKSNTCLRYELVEQPPSASHKHKCLPQTQIETQIQIQTQLAASKTNTNTNTNTISYLKHKNKCKHKCWSQVWIGRIPSISFSQTQIPASNTNTTQTQIHFSNTNKNANINSLPQVEIGRITSIISSQTQIPATNANTNTKTYTYLTNTNENTNVYLRFKLTIGFSKKQIPASTKLQIKHINKLYVLKTNTNTNIKCLP